MSVFSKIRQKIFLLLGICVLITSIALSVGLRAIRSEKQLQEHWGDFRRGILIESSKVWSVGEQSANFEQSSGLDQYLLNKVESSESSHVVEASRSLREMLWMSENGFVTPLEVESLFIDLEKEIRDGQSDALSKVLFILLAGLLLVVLLALYLSKKIANPLLEAIGLVEQASGQKVSRNKRRYDESGGVLEAVRGMLALARSSNYRKNQEIIFVESILDLAPIPFLLLTDKGEVRFVNRSFMTEFGYEEKIEIIGRSLFEFDPIWNDPAVKRIVECVMERDKERIDTEVEIMFRNGRKTLLFSASRLVSHYDFLNKKRSNEFFFLINILDLTKRKQIERLILAAKNKAQEASNAKTAFLANTSHEIRTPLNAIIAFADLLSRTRLTVEQRKYVEIFRRSSHSLLEIVSDILEIAKIENNGLKIRSIQFDLYSLVEEVIELMKAKAELKGIQLEVRYRCKSQSFMGDPVRLRQILVNLVGNAVKFTDVGKVKVFVHSRVDKRVENVQFRVVDSGIGIKKSAQKKIFESFKQAEPYMTRNYGGAGLGLSISKEFVNQMGGVLKVRSTWGMGSVFSFNLLLKIALPSDIKKNGKSLKKNWLTQIRKDFHQRNILLVEDSLDNYEVVKAFLKKSGLNLTFACHGDEALTEFKSNQYDLVLLDIGLPGRDGFSIASEMRTIERLTRRVRTQIVALTAYVLDNKEKRLKRDFDSYLTKPILQDALLEIVYKSLSSFDRSKNVVPIHPGLKKIVPQYLEKQKEEIEKIKQEMKKNLGEYDWIEVLGHRLKGNAETYGFPTLGEMGSNLENFAQSKDRIGVLRTARKIGAFLDERVKIVGTE